MPAPSETTGAELQAKIGKDFPRMRVLLVDRHSGARHTLRSILSTLGFTANLDYSVARNETFWSYFFGERELFNDSWQGTGYCVHAETPRPDDRSGLFGRGIQGILDTVLKTFGI